MEKAQRGAKVAETGVEKGPGFFLREPLEELECRGSEKLNRHNFSASEGENEVKGKKKKKEEKRKNWHQKGGENKDPDLTAPRAHFSVD